MKGREGQGRAGKGRGGQGRAGDGRGWQGRAGKGREGQGRAGQGREGKAGKSRARLTLSWTILGSVDNPMLNYNLPQYNKGRRSLACVLTEPENIFQLLK